MAKDINMVGMNGRLTRDAELSYTPGGQALCKFSLAVNRSRKANGQWVEVASFFDCVLWGKQGEAVAQYLTKGKQISIQGSLRQDRWVDNGSGQNRSKVSIEVDNLQLLGDSHGNNVDSRGQSGPMTTQPAPDPAAPVPGATPPTMGGQQIPPKSNFEDDIPF